MQMPAIANLTPSSLLVSKKGAEELARIPR